jgi:hypothetical protein
MSFERRFARSRCCSMGWVEEIVRRQEALAQGYSDDEIRRQYKRGDWHRVRHGAYVDAASYTTLPAVEKHRLQIESAVPTMAVDAVISHQSAAIWYRLPVWRVALEQVHVTRDRRNGGRIKRDLIVHCAPIDGGVAVVDGRLVTSPARTVVDCALTMPFEQAVIIGDAAVRAFGISADDLAIELDLAKNRRGAPGARRVVTFLDGHSESVGESRSRVMFRALDLPALKTQGNVFLEDGRLLGRVDFYDEDSGVLGEFDGRIKYGRLLKPGQEPGEVVFDEKQREDAMRDPGFQMVRWIWDEISVRATGDRIQRALDRGKASPRPDGYIVQAPLPAPRRLDLQSLR